jgi:hypothetical protein
MMADVSPQAHLVSAASPLSKPCLFIGSLNSCCLLIGFLPLHGLAGFLPPHGFAYLSLLMGYSKSKRTKKNKKNHKTKEPKNRLSIGHSDFLNRVLKKSPGRWRERKEESSVFISCE